MHQQGCIISTDRKLGTLAQPLHGDLGHLTQWSLTPISHFHPDVSTIAECIIATNEAGKNPCQLLSQFWSYLAWTAEKKERFHPSPYCFKTNFSISSLS